MVNESDESTENAAVEEGAPTQVPTEDSGEAPDPVADEQPETTDATTSGFEIKTPDGEVHSVGDLKKVGVEVKDQLISAAQAPATKAFGDWLMMGVNLMKGAVEGALSGNKDKK